VFQGLRAGGLRPGDVADQKRQVFWPFAMNKSCVAASRTCPILPGADWKSE
jgi:hypothetical protein